MFNRKFQSLCVTNEAAGVIWPVDLECRWEGDYGVVLEKWINIQVKRKIVDVVTSMSTSCSASNSETWYPAGSSVHEPHHPFSIMSTKHRQIHCWCITSSRACASMLYCDLSSVMMVALSSVCHLNCEATSFPVCYNYQNYYCLKVLFFFKKGGIMT